MKKVVTLLMLAPAAALAHGGHVEMAAPVHETFHLGPWVAGGLIVAALILARARRQ